SGIQLANYAIIETILINPLTFRYVEGMSLETTSHHQDVAYYKGSARKLSSWLKLLRGKVDIGNLAKLGLAQIKVIMKSLIDYLREKLFDQPTTPLSADLRMLFANNRMLSLFVAESDPGYSLLADGARYMTLRGIKLKRIEVQFIPAADHTFSNLTPRHDLIKRLCAHIYARYDRNHTAEK
ncbi:MAG TPA: hypothetical protein VFM32_09195, partial [Spongiibacteraceae bacterium]|nr:hypothetical protein [Spongiibacteraceae bacterium]